MAEPIASPYVEFQFCCGVALCLGMSVLPSRCAGRWHQVGDPARGYCAPRQDYPQSPTQPAADPDGIRYFNEGGPVEFAHRDHPGTSTGQRKRGLMGCRMPRFRRRSWSPEELRLLNKLVVAGASPRTAAEALNRAKETVRTKARMIGCPFPHRDEVKRNRVLKEEKSRGQMR
jgi:hypothetical protein